MLRRLIDYFRGSDSPTSGPVLRNKPGGMAWIKGVHDHGMPGSEVINGRAVRCLQVVDGCFWVVDPPQDWRATQAFVDDGVLVVPGEWVRTAAIADECLEPWKDMGLRKSEVRRLYEPGPLRVEPVVEKQG